MLISPSLPLVSWPVTRSLTVSVAIGARTEDVTIALAGTHPWGITNSSGAAAAGTVPRVFAEALEAAFTGGAVNVLSATPRWIIDADVGAFPRWAIDITLDVSATGVSIFSGSSVDMRPFGVRWASGVDLYVVSTASSTTFTIESNGNCEGLFCPHVGGGVHRPDAVWNLSVAASPDAPANRSIRRGAKVRPRVVVWERVPARYITDEHAADDVYAAQAGVYDLATKPDQRNTVEQLLDAGVASAELRLHISDDLQHDVQLDMSGTVRLSDYATVVTSGRTYYRVTVPLTDRAEA